jgi:hypothetical protein
MSEQPAAKRHQEEDRRDLADPWQRPFVELFRQKAHFCRFRKTLKLAHGRTQPQTLLPPACADQPARSHALRPRYELTIRGNNGIIPTCAAFVNKKIFGA